MASFSQGIVIGNLTKDPELRYTSSGMAVTNFSVAVNHKFTSGDQKREEVSYFQIEAWGKIAEICSEYLQKGSPVFIEGRLKEDRWEDEHGGKRSRIKIVAQTIQFLPRSDSNSGSKSHDSQNNNPSRGDGHPGF